MTKARITDIPMRGFISVRRDCPELAIVVGLLKDGFWDIIKHRHVFFRPSADSTGNYRILTPVKDHVDPRNLPPGVHPVVLQNNGGKRTYTRECRFNLGLGGGYVWEEEGPGQEVTVWLMPNDVLKVPSPKGLREIQHAFMKRYDPTKNRDLENLIEETTTTIVRKFKT